MQQTKGIQCYSIHSYRRLAKAEYAMGYYYERGIGVTSDTQIAVEWYKKAANQRNARAIQKLKDFKLL